MKRTKIISFANHKGGVGKTTTTVNVGSILARKGYKVLLIDLDAQANLTASLVKQPVEETIYQALTGRCKLPIIQVSENLSMVPASEMLAMVDIELSGAISREKILSGLLGDLPPAAFDFILLDCPPSLGLVTLNAITASTDVIVPLIAEVLPLKGLKMINNFVKLVRTRLNKSAHISGILITRWEGTKLSKTIESSLREALGDLVFQTKIRKNVSVAEAPLDRTNIVEFAPKSNGAADYLSFTEELLLRLESKNKKK